MTARATRQVAARTGTGGREIGPAMVFVLLLAGQALLAGACAAFLLLAGANLAEPQWLHLAWAAVALAAFEAVGRRGRAIARARFGDAHAFGRLVEGAAPGLRTVRALLCCGAIILLAIACARPQWGSSEEEMKRAGVDAWILVDTSKSMLAEDMRPSRLDRAKLAVTALLDRLGPDRVGLIAFAGEARVACPLTLDHGSLQLFVELLEPDMLSKPGTAIAAALDLVARSTSQSEGRSVAAILISDGEDHEGDVERAAGDLARAGVVVHAIGIGRPEGTPLVEPGSADGRPRYHEDADGQTVMTRLDAPTLQAITKATGGVFAQASSTEIEMAAIVGEIGRMEDRELAVTRARVRTERAWIFMALAFALLALEMLLPDGAAILARTRQRASVATRVTA